MTLTDLCAILMPYLPDLTVSEDSDGEVRIHTGMKLATADALEKLEKRD